MAEYLAEVDTIAANPVAPTFENTLDALERSGEAFHRVTAVYDVWSTGMNLGEFQAVEREMGRGSRHSTTPSRRTRGCSTASKQCIGTHRGRGWPGITTRASCAQAARLAGSSKTRVSSINERLAELYAHFSQNLLADEAGRVLLLDSRADLAGLSDKQCAAAASAAADLGHPGKWAILNTRSAMDPFLTYAERRDLREAVWRSYYNRCNNAIPATTRPLSRKSSRCALSARGFWGIPRTRIGGSRTAWRAPRKMPWA